MTLVSSVRDLFLLGSPSDTATASIAVIVAVAAGGVLIHAMSWGRLGPKIGKELREVRLPVLANIDAASAVMDERGPLRVRAAVLHPLPSFVFHRSASAMDASVRLSKAAATNLASISEIGGNDVARVAAIAEASQSACACYALKHDQSSEAAAIIVNLRGHQEPQLSGVTGRAVTAAPSHYFTSRGVGM